LRMRQSTASGWVDWLAKNEADEFVKLSHMNQVYIYSRTHFKGEPEARWEALKTRIDKEFSHAVLFGKLREVISEEAFGRLSEAGKLRILNVVIAHNIVCNTPFGNELDLVMLIEVGYRDEKLFDFVIVAEAKSALRPEHVYTFYNKLRYVEHPIKLRKGVEVWIGRKVKLMEKYGNDYDIKTVHLLRPNVVPILVIGGWEKRKEKTQELCREYGISWIYSEKLTEILGWLTRRKLSMERIKRVWEKTSTVQFAAPKRGRVKEAIRRWFVEQFLKGKKELAD